MFALAVGLISFWLAGHVRGLPGRKPNDPRDQAFAQWWSGSDTDRQALVTHRGAASCPGAPFHLPADGYIGLYYGDPRDPYTEDHRHQGIDIFSLSGPGVVPVYAAYDGYVTREPGWKSALIMRVPDDPFQPGRQIWLYYTHMADGTGLSSTIDGAFPPGTREVFVTKDTLLGYTGDYSGDPLTPVGVHLHFSIVQDDGKGGFLNELEFNNTIDPSRYLGIPVNYACAPVIPGCDPNPLCTDAVLGSGEG